ncbi:5' nucleotidase, NT5C type [Brevibacillus dissolubilis]|uniref:5' nucleotidase, NT5C type n=1 Tax=Brevibacillus dissolubilis TaxID=1844116 RepID=UPI001116AF52|nr:hypothetical protein [Brevibacillus dissolubilis]
MKHNNSLTIGIDIDGTVTHPASIVPLMNQAFGKNLTLDDCFDYNLALVYNITEAEFLQWLETYGEELYRTAPVHGQADEFLRRWYDTHKLVYISAREEKHMDATQSWFSQYNIPYHEIDLVGTHDKLAAARKWQVDLFLEDRLENAVQLSEELSIPVVLFDTPYNRKPLPKLVHRVQTWPEVHELIGKLF